MATWTNEQGIVYQGCPQCRNRYDHINPFTAIHIENEVWCSQACFDVWMGLNSLQIHFPDGSSIKIPPGGARVTVDNGMPVMHDGNITMNLQITVAPIYTAPLDEAI